MACDLSASACSDCTQLHPNDYTHTATETASPIIWASSRDTTRCYGNDYIRSNYSLTTPTSVSGCVTLGTVLCENKVDCLPSSC